MPTTLKVTAAGAGVGVEVGLADGDAVGGAVTLPPDPPPPLHEVDPKAAITAAITMPARGAVTKRISMSPYRAPTCTRGGFPANSPKNYVWRGCAGDHLARPALDQLLPDVPQRKPDSPQPLHQRPSRGSNRWSPLWPVRCTKPARRLTAQIQTMPWQT